jgi:tetratricopeptide (TPR) repeat protein
VAVAEQLPADAPRVCPNCGAGNPAQAVVCCACGVNLLTFESAEEQMQASAQGQAATRRAEAGQSAAQYIAQESAQGRRRMVWLVIVLLAAVIGLLIMIVAITLFVAHQRQMEIERAAATYAAATACLEQGDYRCARDGFLVVLKLQPRHSGARAGLLQARQHLAEEYVDAEQWEKAVTELDALLRDRPGDRDALALLRQALESWLQDAQARGDLLLQWRILRMLNSHFPARPTPRPGPTMPSQAA